MNNTPSNLPSDSSPASRVNEFSIELTLFLNQFSDVPADVQYVLLMCHATECMNAMLAQARKIQSEMYKGAN